MYEFIAYCNKLCNRKKKWSILVSYYWSGRFQDRYPDSIRPKHVINLLILILLCKGYKITNNYQYYSNTPNASSHKNLNVSVILWLKKCTIHKDTWESNILSQESIVNAIEVAIQNSDISLNHSLIFIIWTWHFHY